MSLLFETLLIESGKIPLLDYHNKRCNQTRLDLYGVAKPIDLSSFIEVPSIFINRSVRCRIDYDKEVRTISYQLHQPRVIKSLKLVRQDGISYPYKYADRKDLTALFEQREDRDEVIIVVDGKFTDCYYYNLAFKKGERWLTPNDNLLPGTRRQFLLDQGVVTAASIGVETLETYDQVCLFNALTPFGSVILDCADVML